MVRPQTILQTKINLLFDVVIIFNEFQVRLLICLVFDTFFDINIIN